MSDPGGRAPRERDEGDGEAPAADDSATTAPPPDDRRPRESPPRPDPRARSDDVPPPSERPIAWYLQTSSPMVVASRDVLSSVLLVCLVGLALFAVSGVWPPLVAVESGSMQPNMARGDLVLVVEEDRFASQLATEDGIVTTAAAEETDHRVFGEPGSVIVYRPDGQDGTPIIHRASLYVEEGENWIDRADDRYLGSVEECSEIPRSCPAQYDGYVTRGDANNRYDQVSGQSALIRPGWIEGRAVGQLPYLGCIRLALSDDEGC